MVDKTTTNESGQREPDALGDATAVFCFLFLRRFVRRKEESLTRILRPPSAYIINLLLNVAVQVNLAES